MKQLNLGCGDDYKDGWVNVDVIKSVKADLHFDLTERFPLKSDYFDYILAQDVLEHFTKDEAKRFLKECFRILKVGGKIKLRVPDVFEIFNSMKNSPEDMINYLYGYSDESGVFGVHKYGYTKNTLTKLLRSIGFDVISYEGVTSNHVLFAKKEKIDNKKLKLLISQQDAGAIGGAEIFIKQIADELIKKDVEISLIAVQKSVLNKYYKNSKINLVKAPYRMNVFGGLKGLIKFFVFLPHSIYYYFRILKRFKNRGGSVVLITGFSDKIVLTPLAKLLNLAVVWIEYSPLEEVFKRNFYIPKIFYRAVKTLPDLVIVPCKNTRNLYFAETKIPHHKVKVVNLGLKILRKSQLRKYKKSNSFIKRKYGLSGKTVIGMVSRLQKEKGQDTLIKATKPLKDKIGNLKVVMVGEGAYLEELEKLVKRNNLSDVVTFAGWVTDEEKWKLISTFDLFTFPTRWKLEGFGLVPLEAMMMGVPVVASNFGPVPEVVGDAGVLIEPNEKKLATAISKVLSNKSLSKKLIKKGKERVANNFDIKNVANEFFNEFEALVNIYS